MSGERDPLRMRGVRARALFIAMLALACASAVVSVAAGSPGRLPAVALRSVVLFQFERTIALFTGALLVLIVFVRAWAGELPTEISGRGLKYASRDATKELQERTAASLEALANAVEQVRARQDKLESKLDDSNRQE